jgi:ubiquinone/menaquinone biosynthesis C-methylase UbiE
MDACRPTPIVDRLGHREQGVTTNKGPDRRSEAVRSYFTASSGYWSRVYEDDTVMAQVYRERQARVMRCIDRVAGPGSVVADIGAGAGHLAVALATQGFEVVAVDNSDAMLRETAQNGATAGVNDRLKCVLSDAEDLQLPDSSFDIVVAVGLIPWVDRPARAIAEMSRVVKSGGHIVLTMDSAYGVVRLLDPGWHPRPRSMIRAARRALHLEDVNREDPWPRSHTWSQVEGLMQASGLTIIERGGVGFGPFMFLGRRLIPAALGRRLDRALQAISDRRVPFFRTASLFHIVLAQKTPPSERTAGRGRHVESQP